MACLDSTSRLSTNRVNSLQVCNTSQGITVFLVDQPHQVCLMAAILGSLVGSCAKKLQEVITEEAVLILGVKEDLRELQRIMIQIRCFLNDAEARRTEETSVNNWLGELRDAMYYADDIIDLARSEGGKPTKCSGISFSTCIPVVQKRHKIAVQIRDFNADLEIEKISKSGERFLKHQNMQPKAEVRTLKHMGTSHLVEPNLVGKHTLRVIRDLHNWEDWSFIEDAAGAAAIEECGDIYAEMRKGEALSPRLHLLPRLKKMELGGCHKLRALPRQLGRQHATSLKELHLRGASCLKVEEDLQFLSEKLLIVGCDL
ncbi:hypothetical protein VPH35_021643 [Triticum aestivum]